MAESTLVDLLLTWFPEAPPHLDAAIDEALPAQLLPDKPNRVKHILGVTGFARELGAAGGNPAFAERLATTALAHDIGYAESLRRTGFHPLDGAIFLAHRGAEDAVIHAVLHHTGAREEAKHIPAAAPFYEIVPFVPTLLDDAITFCDTQTSPVGQRVTVEERISEIVDRYGADSQVSQVMRRMQPEFMAIFGRVSPLLSRNGGPD